MTTNHRRSLAACAALALAAAGSAAALELNYATSSSPQHPRITDAIEPLLERLEEKSAGEISGRVYAGGQLLGARALLEGLADGVTQSAEVIAQFYPSEIPHYLTLANMVTMGDDPLAVSAAINEMVLLDCPSCKDDYAEHNALMLASFATTGYILHCSRAIEGPDDLQGLRVRSTGIFSDYLTDVGANPINLVAPESAEALERNQVDCVLGPFEWLQAFGLQDSVTHIYDIPLGLNRALGLFVVNRDTWDEATEEERQLIIDEMPQLLADSAFAYNIEAAEETRAWAEENGIEVSEGSAELRAALTPSNERQAILERAEELGVDNAEELIGTFQEHLAKWEGIMADIGRDKDAYRQALADEIYSKVSTDQ